MKLHHDNCKVYIMFPDLLFEVLLPPSIAAKVKSSLGLRLASILTVPC